MTTRFEDGVSVVGEEFKSEVEDLENELQKNPQLKSEVEEIIMRSISEVDNEIHKGNSVDLNLDNYKVITSAEFKPLFTYIQKMSDDGVLTEDNYISVLDEMLHWISSFYENKSMAGDKYEELKKSLVELAKRKDVTEADKKRAIKEYGDVNYADEKNKKYPVDTESHIRSAWNYIHQKRNADKYSAEDLKKIKNKIIAAWKKIIGGEPPSVDKSMTDEEILKDMGETVDGTMDKEMYMPLGGATSLTDAQAFIDAKELEFKIYQAYSLFGVVMNNIMACDCSPEERAMMIQTALNEFRDMLDPQTLEELSMAEKKETKQNETKVEEVEKSTVNSPENDRIAKLEQMVLDLSKNLTATNDVKETKSEVQVSATQHPLIAFFSEQLTQSIEKSGDERKMAFQNILNSLGEKFMTIQNEGIKEEVDVTNEGQLKSMVDKTLDEKLNPLKEQLSIQAGQMTQLSQMLQTMINSQAARTPVQNKSQAVKLQPPQLKAQVMSANQSINPVQRSNANGFSIREIVKKTTTG